MASRSWSDSSKVAVSMLLVQAFATGLQLLTRVILGEGMFIFALMTYRHIVAAICVAPFAFYFERNEIAKVRFSISIWIWLFINALTGITCAMSLYYYGLRATTATFATNFLNLIPIVTFVFAVLLRLEALNLLKRAAKVKTLGALLCIGGALMTSLYHGKSFYIISKHRVHPAIGNEPHNWTTGTIMLSLSCLSYGSWYIVQLKLLKIFSLRYWSTMLTCILAAFQSMIIGISMDRRSSAWRLGWNLQLLTIFYSGAFATATTICLLIWAIAKKGPTYPSMFNPLTLIFVAILEALILGEPIWLGTLLGTILILIGIYSYLWGKKKELTETETDAVELPAQSAEVSSAKSEDANLPRDIESN
ncbi:hypothetical protein MLD38_002979 [Melastoma candidum]|uniref:Uncharacterized protein n=1 Tax=Melastoma candidum TaxID=119954 RepID=A0ACB9S9P5_9MYRT|nr:hypothetical protein MLD38_002979 [Melastoma candidum]